MNGKSIFSQLPNHLIMNIIKITKSSVDYENEHKFYMEDICLIIDDVIEEFPAWCGRDEIYSDQFFCELFHNEALTDTIVKYRSQL